MIKMLFKKRNKDHGCDLRKLTESWKALAYEIQGDPVDIFMSD